jgi:hypothetical protein
MEKEQNMTIRYQATNIVMVEDDTDLGLTRLIRAGRYVQEVDVPNSVEDEDIEDFVAAAIEEATGFEVESFDLIPMRLTTNLLNADAGEFYIPADTPYYCDPGSETYHSM